MRWLFPLAFFAATAQAELAWQPSMEIASGRGERGPWQQNESRYNYVDDGSVALDERGGIALVWVDQGRKDVFFQRLKADGSKEGAAVNVSRSGDTFSWLPRVAIAPGDARKIFILWQEIIFSGGSHGGEMLFSRSLDGGATFTPPLNLSNSVAGDGKGRINPELWHNGSYDLVVGADGSVLAAWTEYEGALWVARSSDGERFPAPLKIAEAKPARGPSLAAGKSGVYLAWTVGDDESADIRVARSRDGGASFEAPRLVERTKAYSDAPKLALEGDLLHLVFAEGRRIRYTRSSDHGASFARPRDLVGRDAGFPSLAVDGQGGVYVTWERFADHRYRPRGLGFAVSRDSGKTFSHVDVLPGTVDPTGGWNGSHQGLLMKKLAVNRQGGIALINSALKDGAGSRVWLLRAAASVNP